MDFYQIKERCFKKGVVDIYPEFKVGRSKDLMVRGKSFYAIWDDEKGLWSTDEYDVQRIVDKDLINYFNSNSQYSGDSVVLKTMSDFSSNSWLQFRNYITHVSDNSHQLDTKLTFSNTEVKKTDYVSKKLEYPLEEGPHDAYDELIGTLYDEDEKKKLEWAIGSIIAGEAAATQKFIVLYGEQGAGKSTFLEIVQKIFKDYYAIFEAKALTTSNNLFSTEVFKNGPLVAIQHDGDLSRIEDNTKLNSIVSHEEILINEKHKPSYSMKLNCFLFMATNKPVKITDAKSGIIRRLIDVKPSGNKVSAKRYQELKSQIDFELGSIAYHCLQVYKEMGKNYYSTYRPVDMMYKTDPFFNFVEDNYETFKEQDGVTLKAAYALYKQYCDESCAEYKLQMYKFREELKNYFKNFEDFVKVDDKFVRSYYSGFITKKFERVIKPVKEENSSILVLDSTESILDKVCENCPAQYASSNETPLKKWEKIKTNLSDIDTHKLHYVKLPENHIVIDFDLKDENGNKSAERNLEAASKWPTTYAEFSKGGCGVHLHYFYSGNVSELSRVYDTDIEIKLFTGNASLRRKLTKCNNAIIAMISSGLPLKAKGDKVVNFEGIKNEKALRTSITKALNKEVHASTKPNIDFITKVLEDAYDQGIKYDVTNMRPAILNFASNSSNQAEYCIKAVNKMKFKSEENSVSAEKYKDDTPLFFDLEVFLNVFIMCFKKAGPNHKPVKMINPSPEAVEAMLKYKLIGFNCRRYDNHILYAAMMGYTNEQLYQLSKRIINTDKKSDNKNCFFGEAYNLSYTDVYDYLSAGNKMSLKKWEIKLKIHHQENNYDWDKPLPKEHWDEVADYCCNDVIATEAVHDENQEDWLARQILAELAGMTVNDTTNTLTTKIIFGNNKHPQDEFNYRDLSKPVNSLDDDVKEFITAACPEMMAHKHDGHGTDLPESLLPYFPGYTFDHGISTYRGVEVGEGGVVLALPGMHGNVALLDIMSMHPHSTIAECLFGPRYTKAYRDIVYGRVNIKHEAWSIVNEMLDGKLAPFIQKVIDGELTADGLANALKTAINSVYGLTSASFENPFRDPRNIDNIVAKRGALFMIDLKYEVEKRGFIVAHIKTDSIKIPDATPEIIKFVMDFGKKYGYTFEHEATYDRMCLVNNAVYIAKYATVEKCNELYGYVPKNNSKHPEEWTATGKQFAVPYTFKTLFSKEPVELDDMCETMAVTSSLYLDFNEGLSDLLFDENGNPIPEEAKHNYRFVGKVGSFCPVKPRTGGGELLREGKDKAGNLKYSSATGAKGYRWKEAEIVKALKLDNDIDKKYYEDMLTEAVNSISSFGDFEWFVSDDPYVGPSFETGEYMDKPVYEVMLPWK